MKKAVFSKLSNKEDWIRQVSTIKKAILKHWQNMLKMENSYKTKVNINRGNHLTILFNVNLTPSMSNKDIYTTLLNHFAQDKPVGFLIWEKILQKKYSLFSTVHVYFHF